MAEKRITTVDEIMTVDEDADYVLVSRGVQQDLKRLLMRRLPTRFDLHDDVSDQLTTLAAADRMLISDESAVGDPQRYVLLGTLKSYLLDLFDLHDDVPDELTAAADNDRMLISDESAVGDPQKWISVENLLETSRSWADTTERALGDVYAGLSHSLGKTPTRFKIDLVCTGAEFGWAVGDKVVDYSKAIAANISHPDQLLFCLFGATLNSYSVIAANGADEFSIPNKNSGAIQLTEIPTGIFW